jgi:DNA-binding NarL/FixJ family response regulator
MAIVFERTRPELETLADVVAGLRVAVLARCSASEEVFPLVEELRPNLLVVGLSASHGEGEGVAFLQQVRDRLPSLEVIVVSGSEDDAQIHGVLAAGADAYVLATEDRDELAAAIRAALDRSMRKVSVRE